MGEGHHPRRPASAAGVETGRGAPDLEQDLLGDLLSLRRIPQHAADQAEHLAADAVVDRLEGGQIAAGHPSQQRAEITTGPGLLALGGRLARWPVIWR